MLRDEPSRRPRSRSRSRSPRRDDRDRARPRDSRRDGDRRRSRSLAERDNEHDRDRRRDGRRERSRSRSPVRRRSRSRSAERDRRRHRRRSRSHGSSSGASDSDSSRGRHARRRKRSRSRSRSRSRDHERERKKRKDKDRKDKDKKKKKSKKSKSTVVSQWGKYGIIHESDMYTKDDEFSAWLLEEQKVNPETVSKDQTRKLFSKFVEDYNTGTLPHEKYYNLARYEARMTMLRSGETLPAEDTAYDFASDVASHVKSIKSAAPVTDLSATYSRGEVEELRRVQRERVQVGKMKVLGMDVKTNMGVRMVDGDDD